MTTASPANENISLRPDPPNLTSSSPPLQTLLNLLPGTKPIQQTVTIPIPAQALADPRFQSFLSTYGVTFPTPKTANTASETVAACSSKRTALSDNEFTPVKTRRKTNVVPNEAVTPTTISNRYAALSRDDHPTEAEAEVDVAAMEEEPPTPQPKTKIPPIYLSDIRNWQDKFNDFRAVSTYLRSKGLEHYTYTLKSDKKPHFVLRGLPNNTPIDSIEEALADLGFPTDQVVQLKSTRPSPIQQAERNAIRAVNPDAELPAIPPRDLPLFQVRLQDSSRQDEFLQTSSLLHLRTNVEPFRQPVGPPQCLSCQRYGHTHKTCGLRPRCVKCAGDHHYKDCVKPKDVPAKCVNCGGPHTANYRGCVVHRELMLKIRAKRDAINTTFRPTATPSIPRSSFPPLQNAWHSRPNPSNNSLQPESNANQPQTSQQTSPSTHPQSNYNSGQNPSPSNPIHPNLKTTLLTTVSKLLTMDDNASLIQVLKTDLIPCLIQLLNGL
ncbi:uncharacterized protein [Hetaerina americana]|uniref:uncharacterized protein n=1 Tax=Hetaerina americana TaxID=62018 RepID=UPI003A7F3230